ncbi:hypothetical protein IFR04_016255, partial [Cadophora malorum]
MFECRGMYCLETFNLPYRSMQGNESKEPHSEPILEVQYRGNGENFMGLFALDVSRRQEHILHRISEFTQRDLSQISDRLNAFRGILGFFGKKFGMRHLWGSPIMEQRLVHVKSSQRQLYFLLGLCWCFGPDQGGNQATNLPSWSWSGWSGHCQYINTVMNEQTFDYFTKDKNPTREEGGTISDMEVTVQVEESPEHVLDWTAFYASYTTIPVSSMGRFIHIDAWTFPVVVSQNDWQQHLSIALRDAFSFEMRKATLTQTTITSCQIENGHSEELQAVLLCQSRDPSNTNVS